MIAVSGPSELPLLIGSKCTVCRIVCGDFKCSRWLWIIFSGSSTFGHPEDIYIAGVQPCLCWVSFLLCREAEVCFHVCLRNRSISSFSLRSPGPRSVVQPCTEISVSPQFWCYSLRGDYMVLCVITVILLRENARLLRRIFSNIIIHNTSLIRSVTS